MILDSSAVLAIMGREAQHERLVAALAEADALGIGAPTVAEIGIVLAARLRRDSQGVVARFLQEFEIEVITFGAAHWKVAVEAYARYGKGRHPAGLNFGDCMTYAVARLADQPLLFVGRDFIHTDLAPA